MFGWWRRRFGGSLTRRRLARLVMGDEPAAERLIAYELQQAPWLSREEATRRALDRLVHERTR